MATRSIHDTVRAKRVLQMQTISGSALNSGDVDTRGFESVMFLVDFGDIVEMGASPIGAAQIAIKLEHADDDGSGSPGSYAAVATGDVDGHTPDSQGVVATPTSDLDEVTFGTNWVAQAEHGVPHAQGVEAVTAAVAAHCSTRPISRVCSASSTSLASSISNTGMPSSTR